MTASYELEFETKPYGFRIVGDDHNKNAIVKAILNPILAKSLYVGSWITQINDIVVETWEFSKIISVLRDAQLPVLIKFRQCLILSGTDEQLISHQFTPNLQIEVSDTGKEPSQQKQGKPFVAYNLLVSDSSNKIPLKWQLWKRYNQFETLHKQLLRIVPDLPARLPPKQHFGRFKPGFIQQRRVQLQKYIDDIKHHPGIVNCNEFRNFLIPMSFNELQSKQHTHIYNNPSEMKPILLEIRDRLEILCDQIEMNTINRENILSSVRYLLSIVTDTCHRTKDPMDATTVSRNFITGLPNNNAFIKIVDQIFYGKYLLSDNGNHNNENNNNDNGNENNNNNNENQNQNEIINNWGLLLIDVDNFTKIIYELNKIGPNDSEIGPNLLRHLSQTIYSCVTSSHQKVFHLDSDQFALLSPINTNDDLQRLAGIILTKIRNTQIPGGININKQNIPSEKIIYINDKNDKNEKNNKKYGYIEYNNNDNIIYVYMTVSMGISMLSNNTNRLNESPADWIQRADLSLQRAKKKGKNCIGPLLEECNRFDIEYFRNDIRSQWFESAAKGEHSRILEMVKTGKIKNIDTLQVSYDSDTKLTALMTSSIYNHSEVARTLLRYNANVNLQDEYGRTSLIHSSQNDSYKTAKVLLETKLQKYTIDINKSDKTNKTALMYASLLGNIRIISLLLQYNININHQDSQGLTSLMFAIQSESFNSKKIINLLLDKHPDLTLQDEFGQTCLFFATKKNYYNIVARMIQFGAQINAQNNNGLTCLMWSAFLGHLSTVNILLQYNADKNLQTQHGSTALLFAAESGHTNITENLIKNNNININHQDNDGDTATHAAALNGHLNVVKLLYNNGAKMNIVNKNNHVPLDYAIQRQYKDIIEFLTPLMHHTHNSST